MLLSRITLTRLWGAKKRSVPLAVMLTTLQKESGVGDTNGDGLSDQFSIIASRFEPQLMQADWVRKACARIGHTLVPEIDCMSWGPYQMLGIILLAEVGSLAYKAVPRPDPSQLGWDLEHYVMNCMSAYDKFMTTLLFRAERKGLTGDDKLHHAFAAYNGSNHYAAEAMIIYHRITDPRS